ncbi:MAG: type II toxin-antitoxin system HicB family antitoxin [Verrucomicrobiota bacterium]
MTFKAVIHEAEEGGYWAEVPALPGCASQGESLAELEINLKEAIELWLEAGEDTIQIATEHVMEVAL